ncbi:C39 family peptidase [candidate division WWE3 bacterium]|nr:C39 family peptidase [candidate division WWE3 bacterium]
MTENKNFETSNHFINSLEKDSNSIFIEVHSEEQEKSYSCGPAVLCDVLKTLGKDVNQIKIINEVIDDIKSIRPKEERRSLAGLVTPPEVIEGILTKYNVETYIKDSVENPTEQTNRKSEAFLDEMLENGYVVICPVQTIPNYGHERDVNEDGHYLIVCGKVMINGKKHFIVVDPMFHYYQRLSNENSVYGMHMGKDINEETPKTEAELMYDSVETRDIDYTPEQLAEFGINPKGYGIRFVNASNFMRNWKDVSGFGKPFNQYGIAVKIK